MSRRLLVVGAGTMGTQIALQAALHDIFVALVDASDDAIDRSRAEASRLTTRRVDKGTMSADEQRQALHRLTYSSQIDEPASSADWAIEAVVERLDVKRAVFTQLDRALPPHAGIATNSSSIVSSELAGATSRPERCINMHFFHPVTVMDLCEIVAGPHTSEHTVAEAEDWARAMARTPVLLRKEIDGFVVNRILGAASREAFFLADDGVAEPQVIDVAVRRALGWPLGPFQLADLSGLDVLLDIRRARYERRHDPQDVATIRLLEQQVQQGRLGRKSGAGFYEY
jgi:3-hydroxybutyryl-CoA dehydrogenase